MKIQILKYFIYTVLFWLTINSMVYYYVNFHLLQKKSIEAVASNLRTKTNYYIKHSDKYDLIFLGDSRTYCAFDTELIDSLLSTNSINLAHWANWFPTQYSQFQDIIPYIKPGTKVVWSVGHQNFDKSEIQSHVYPIKLKNINRFLGWGFSWADIEKNVLNNSTFFYLFGLRESIRVKMNNRIDKEIIGFHFMTEKKSENPSNTHKWVNETEYYKTLDRFKKEKGVFSIEPITQDSLITSLEIKKVGGSYCRVELEPQFFRKKQKEDGSMNALKKLEYNPDEAYWNCFLATVQLFKKYNIDLIISEIEEAPYRYPTSEDKEKYRAFMKRVEQAVLANGFDYIRVDFDRFSDTDYFDYNHLNHKGVEKFISFFSKELAISNYN